MKNQAWKRPTAAGLVAFGLGFSLFEGQSFAAEEVHAFLFQAREECGTKNEFLEAFAARTTEVRLIPGSSGSPILIEVVEDKAKVRANLMIRLRDGSVVRRSLEAVSCDEALEAIAFVTALALDPRAVSPLRVAPTPPSPGPEFPPDIPNPVLEHSHPDVDEPSETWTVGLAANTSVGPAPNPLFGGELALGWEPKPHGYWAPALRISGTFQSSADFSVGSNSAHFERWLTFIDLCPLGTGPGFARLHLCANAAGGALFSDGQAAQASASSVRPWWEIGVNVLGSVDLGGSFAATFRGGAGFPLVRDTFQFDTEPFHEVPRVVGNFGVGLEMRIP